MVYTIVVYCGLVVVVVVPVVVVPGLAICGSGGGTSPPVNNTLA
jgi:hypothetical protein